MINNEDGVPHFAYYIKGIETSFVWRLDSDEIQICPGGYGEPPTGSIPLYVDPVSLPIARAFDFVQAICDNYADEVMLSRSQQSV